MMFLEKFIRFIANLIKISLRILIVLIGLTISVILYGLSNPPKLLIDELDKVIEESVIKSIGLKLKINNIEKISINIPEQVINIQNVYLFESDKKNSNVFLKLKRIDIKLDIFGYLFEKKNSISNLTIESPEVYLVLDKNGKINLKLKTYPPKPKKEVEEKFEFKYPNINLKLVNTNVNFKDIKDGLEIKVSIPIINTSLFETKDILFKLINGFVNFKDIKKDFDTKINVPEINALLLKEKDLSCKVSVISEQLKINTKVDLDINSGKGNGEIKLSEKDISRWTNYLVRVPVVKIPSGELNVKLSAFWKDFKFKINEIKYNGEVNLKDVIARTPYLPSDIHINSARLKLDQDKINVDHINLSTILAFLQIRGDIFNYINGKPDLNIHIFTPGINLSQVNLIVPPKVKSQIDKLRISGTLVSKVNVIGNIQNPVIDGELSIPRASGMNIGINNLKVEFNFHNKNLKIPFMRVSLFGGNINGNMKIDLSNSNRPYFDGKVNISQLSLKRIINDLKIKIPYEYKPSGNINSNILVKGTPKNPSISGNINASMISFPNSSKISPIKSINTKLSYQDKNAEVDLNLRSIDIGNLDLRVKMIGKKNIKGNIQIIDLPLKTANKWVSGLSVKSGIGNLKLDLMANLDEIKKNWQNFDAIGNLKIRNVQSEYKIATSSKRSKHLPKNSEQLKVASEQSLVAGSQSNKIEEKGKELVIPQIIKQDLNKFDLAVKWKNGKLKIDNTEIIVGKSLLRAHGGLYPFKLTKKSQNNDPIINIILETNKMNVFDFPITQLFGVNQGNIQIKSKVKNLKNEWEVDVKSDLKDLIVREYSVDNINLDISMKNNLINLNKVLLRQGDDEIELNGKVDVTSKNDPKLNLSISTNDFEIPTILTFLPPGIMKEMEEANKKLMTPKPDPKPVIYKINKVRNLTPQIDRAIDYLNTLEKCNSVIDSEIPSSDVIKYWEFSQKEPLKPEYIQPKKEIPPFWEKINGKISTKIDINGSTQNPRIFLSSLITEGEVYDKNIPEIFLKLDFSKEKLKVDRFHIIEKDGGVFMVNGFIDKIGKKDSTLQLEILGNGFNLSSVNSWLREKAELYGNTNLTVTAEGKLNNPHVLMLTEIKSGQLLTPSTNLFFDSFEILGEVLNNVLEITNATLSYGDKQIVVSGNVPIKDKKAPMDVSLRLEAPSLSLINLFTKGQVNWLEGNGGVLVKVVGTPDNPQLDGRIQIKDGKIFISALKSPLEKVDGDIEINTNKVTLKHLKANLNNAPAVIKGDIDLLDFIPAFLNLNFTTDHLPFVMPGLLDSVISAKIGIKGDYQDKIVLSGDLVLEKGEFNIPLSGGAKKKEESATKKKGGSIYFSGLKIKTLEDEDFWIRIQPFLELPPKGELNIRGSLDDINKINIKGTMNATKGSLVLNKRFKIKQAKLEFGKKASLGEAEQKTKSALDPTMDIIAELKVPNPNKEKESGIVQAQLKGTLEDLKSGKMSFSFPIKPQGITDGDILSYLYTNVDVGEFVTGTLLSPFTSKIAELIGLKDISFDLEEGKEGKIVKLSLTTKPFLWGFTGKFNGEFSTTKIKYNTGLNYRINDNLGIKGNIDQDMIFSTTIDVGYQLNNLIEYFNKLIENKESKKIIHLKEQKSENKISE